MVENVFVVQQGTQPTSTCAKWRERVRDQCVPLKRVGKKHHIMPPVQPSTICRAMRTRLHNENDWAAFASGVGQAGAEQGGQAAGGHNWISVLWA
jgi:hypothetical protein